MKAYKLVHCSGVHICTIAKKNIQNCTLSMNKFDMYKFVYFHIQPKTAEFLTFEILR